MGGRCSTRCRQPLISGALPSHMASSTSMYERKLRGPSRSSSSLLRPDIGWGKSRVGDHGCGNITWSGTESASARWMCAKVGGLAMMASATKGSGECVYGSTALTAGHCEYTISLSILSLASFGLRISPVMVPPVSTIHSESSFGSPPSG